MGGIAREKGKAMRDELQEVENRLRVFSDSLIRLEATVDTTMRQQQLFSARFAYWNYSLVKVRLLISDLGSFKNIIQRLREAPKVSD